MCIQKYIAKATGFCNKDYSLRTEIHDIHVDVYNTYLYCAVVLGLKKKLSYFHFKQNVKYIIYVHNLIKKRFGSINNFIVYLHKQVPLSVLFLPYKQTQK